MKVDCKQLIIYPNLKDGKHIPWLRYFAIIMLSFAMFLTGCATTGVQVPSVPEEKAIQLRPRPSIEKSFAKGVLTFTKGVLTFTKAICFEYLNLYFGGDGLPGEITYREMKAFFESEKRKKENGTKRIDVVANDYYGLGKYDGQDEDNPKKGKD